LNSAANELLFTLN